jgi:hypothetical protein
VATEKHGAFRTLRVKKTDSLRTIYAKVRRSFTAVDLARYLENYKPGIPGEQLLADLEAIHKDELRRMRNAKRRA